MRMNHQLLKKLLEMIDLFQLMQVNIIVDSTFSMLVIVVLPEKSEKIRLILRKQISSFITSLVAAWEQIELH
jgi:hypothetical protein